MSRRHRSHRRDCRRCPRQKDSHRPAPFRIHELVQRGELRGRWAGGTEGSERDQPQDRLFPVAHGLAFRDDRSFWQRDIREVLRAAALSHRPVATSLRGSFRGGYLGAFGKDGNGEA